MIPLFILLSISSVELKNRDCHIVCLNKYYNGGMFDAKLDDCLCFDRYDYQDCMHPIRLPVYISPHIPSENTDF